MPDTPPPSPQITVVTCVRDEGPYLAEWVAHLRMLGVTRIVVYTNDCADGSEALVEALGQVGVYHVPQGKVRHLDGPTPQWRALRQAWDHPAVVAADWVLHLDVDEWIALDGPTDLLSLIAACGAAQAIALPWRLFGNAGWLEAGQGTTPERFTTAAPEAMVFPALGSFFKTLFRRDGPFTGLGVHRPRQSDPPLFADDTGRLRGELAEAQGRILLQREGPTVPGRLVQVNHYSVRSIHEFLVKRLRGLPNRSDKAIDLTYWVERNFNTQTCTRIAPQIPAMLAELARLRALPGVAEAEAIAHDWHRGQLRAILDTSEGAQLCGRLAMAGDSTVVDAPLGRGLLRQYQAARRNER